MFVLMLVWIALSLALLYFGIGRRNTGGGLTLSYFLALSLLHVPGAMAYLEPSSELIWEEETTLGFELTVIGMAAFVAGAIAVRVFGRSAPMVASIPKAQEVALGNMSREILILGFLAYFVALPISKLVPSATSLVDPLKAFMVLGFWIMLYQGIVTGNPLQKYVPFLAIPVLPILTTISGGFIGFGVYWGLSIVSFFISAVRRRGWMIVLAPVVCYVGLSVFVTYMRDRDLVRAVVWYEEDSSWGERFSRFWSTVTDFEFLDLQNPNHLMSLHNRLNQNYFVGLAIQRHEQGLLDFLYGSTVPVWALVPRAIWPEKPDVGGGRTVVKDVTGLDLDESTSFGAGQILEFYVNFGTFGVIIGMFGLGALLRRLDQGIIRALNELDARTLLVSAMPGFVLLQPTGNLLEIIVSVVAAIVVGFVTGVYMNGRLKPRALAGPSHIR
jgi:hypothetical protein